MPRRSSVEQTAGAAVLSALLVMSSAAPPRTCAATERGHIAAAAHTATKQLAQTPAPVMLEGPATVIDGDTLRVQGTKIRVFGIDAPESAQLCQNGKGASYKVPRG